MSIILIILTGFLAAFIGTLPPGLINMNTARIAIIKSRNDSEQYNYGATIASGFYALLAVIIFNNIPIDNTLFNILYIAGAVILTIIAIVFFIKYLKNKNAIQTKEIKYKSSFKYGLQLSLLNVIQLPFYITVCIIYLNNHNDYLYLNYVYIMGVMLGIFTVLSAYKVLFIKYSNKKFINQYFFKYSYLILAILCIILAIITICKI